MDHGGSNVVGFFVIVAIFIGTGLAFLFFLAGLAKGFGKRSGLISIILGVILLPLLGLSIPIGCSMMRSQADQERREKENPSIFWAYLDGDLNFLIHKFYLDHPESFTFPESDEGAESPALWQYLANQNAWNKSGFSEKNGVPISSSGEPILLAIDTNGDGYVATGNYVGPLPWKNKPYRCLLLRRAPQSESVQPAGWVRLN